MNGRLTSFAAVLTLLALDAGASTAVADEAAPVYDRGAVALIELTLSEEAIDALEAEPDEYQPGTFSFSYTSGPPGEEEASTPIVLSNVGIRLKGGLGSFRPLTGKAAFKLKFNESVSGQKFQGQKKMTLNNMVQDASMVHETLAYEAFRALGVPAPRSGFAYVRVNGEDFGLYLDIESLDDVALKRIFGSFDDETQHLYEGELGADVVPPLNFEGAGGFEVDEGDDADVSDLEALAAVAPGPNWSSRIGPFADLTEMTRMWAVEKYIEHWDGYAGHTEPGQQRPNNYYLFSEPSGLFQMLPWGTDQTWRSNLGIKGQEVSFDGHGGVLFNRCLEDSTCAQTYREALEATVIAVDALEPDAITTEIAALLKPWQELEQANSRHEHDLDEIAAGLESTRSFIAGRSAETTAWLATHLLPDPPSSPQAASGGPPAADPGTVVSLGAATRAGGALRLRLRFPAAGRLKLRGTISTRDGTVLACHEVAWIDRAGTRTLRCSLSDAVKAHLRRRWLRLRLAIRFEPAVGSPQVLVDRVTLSRT